MNVSPSSNNSIIELDPRSISDFMERFLPLCNGKPAPPIGASGRNERIMIEFLVVYYHLNCFHLKLCDLRARAEAPDRPQSESDCLRELEKVLVVRDALEDRYAPCGILADPVVEDGFTVNIRFSFGNADSRGRPRGDLYRLTAEIPIPLPRGAKLTDYIVDFEGPEPFMPLPD
jgi:hypothetical protein